MWPDHERHERGRRARKLAGIGRAGGIAALSLVMTAALGWSTEAGAASAHRKKHAKHAVTNIKVGVAPSIDGMDIYIAQVNGYFKKRHLNVTAQVMNGGAAILPALEGGSLQVGSSNVLSEIQGAATGVVAPCFAGSVTLWPTGNFIALVGSPGVTSPKQFAGKSIVANAVGGISQLMIDAYLEAHHVTYKSVHVVGAGYPDQLPLLQKGQVAGGLMAAPFATEAIKDGMKLLSPDVLTDVPHQPVFSCWIATRNWLSAHSTQARQFVHALAESNKYIVQHPQKALDKIAHIVTLTPAKVKGVTPPHFTNQMSRKTVSDWEQEALKFNMITKRVPVSKVYVPLMHQQKKGQHKKKQKH